MTKILDSKIPEGPIAEKWTNYKAHQKSFGYHRSRYWFGWCFCRCLIG